MLVSLSNIDGRWDVAEIAIEMRSFLFDIPLPPSFSALDNAAVFFENYY